jgi:hypothetical protein
VSNLITVSVAKSTQSSSINATAGIRFWTHTLQVKGSASEVKTVQGPFGAQTVGGGARILDTYYLYKQNGEAAVGMEADINLDEFNLVEEDFTTDSGKDIVLKKLFPKS